MCGRLRMCIGPTRHPADSVYTKGINERETMNIEHLTQDELDTLENAYDVHVTWGQDFVILNK